MVAVNTRLSCGSSTFQLFITTPKETGIQQNQILMLSQLSCWNQDGLPKGCDRDDDIIRKSLFIITVGPTTREFPMSVDCTIKVQLCNSQLCYKHCWRHDQSSTYILRRLKVWAGPATNEKWWLDQTQALFYALLKVFNDVDSMFDKQIQTIFEFLEIFRSNVLAFKS